MPATEKASKNSDESAEPHLAIPLRQAFTELGRPDRDRIQLEVAEYIESMCIDLRAMARAVELDGLAYFLDMTRLEASIQVENLRPDKSPAAPDEPSPIVKP